MSEQPVRVDLATPNLAADKRSAFDDLFPGVLADGVLDAARLGELLDTEVTAPPDGRERFGLMWAGKQDAVRSLLTPGRGALVPELDKSIDFDTAQNVFIEGDNLEVLKLLQKAYNDKVELIYIDPPYNTGGEFIYNDDFTDGLRAYLEYTGQIDVEGNRASANAEIAGRRHSRWLSMMYPRLVLARNLLTRNGFIFISIDDNEVATLRLLCDEIFGPENFVTSIMWKRKKETSNDSKNVSVQGEYIVVYSRSADSEFQLEPLDQSYLDASYRSPTEAFPDGLWRPVPLTVSKGLKGGGYQYSVTTPTGTVHDRVWAYPQHRYEELVVKGRVYFGESGAGIPQRVMYAHESGGKPTTNYWDNTATNKAGKKLILDLFGENVFETPKPVELLQRVIRLIPNKELTVLDFFAGSGTSAHAVALQNAADGGRRRALSINIPEPTNATSEAYKAGYPTVSAVTLARLRRVAEIVEGAGELGLRVLSLGESHFRDPTLTATGDLFDLHEATLANADDDLEAIAAEVLLKEGVALDAAWERHTAGGADVIVADGVAVVGSLDITDDVVSEALELEPRVLVFLEDGFASKDSVKANAFTNARNLGITMKTV